ncbi:centrosomal protein of 162 kDa isoform X2 [Trichomycterus rosablanca]|uniref:centrosomal protein of 162 kDa isoform X2 n=1 Tax=Trichomycterus rosablanca TaxID=2290929 RepID=UPI002F3502D4
MIMAYRLTQEELDQQFEQFLKESVSDDSFELGNSSKPPSVLDQLGKKPQPQVKNSQASVPWWHEDDSDDAQGRGMVAAGRTFHKSLRKSQSIKEVDEDQTKEQHFEDEPKAEAVTFTRDSLEPDDSLTVSGSATSTAAPGLATVKEEEEEKARFLAVLDRDAVESADGGMDKVQESCSSSSMSPQREDDAAAFTKQDQTEEEKDLHSVRASPASPAYSDDFEDEASEKEPEEKKPERCGMLAKVSLHDSLNLSDVLQLPAVHSNAAEGMDLVVSSMAQAAGPSATGQSYGQSGASEVEALQEAYRQITHLMGECEEQEQERCRSPPSPTISEALRKTLQHASTAESDLPTAEELMCAIRPDSGFTYNLHLKALSEEPEATDAKSLNSEGQAAETENADSPVAHRVVDSESPAVMESCQSSPHHIHMSIAEQVKMLMQENDDTTETQPTVFSKDKRRQVPSRSTTTAQFSNPSRRAPVPAARSKKQETRPLPKASTTSRPGTLAKPPSLTAQKKSQNQRSNRKTTLSQTHVVKGRDSGLAVRDDLISSVQSFADFLQQQLDEDGLNMHSLGCSDSSTHQPKSTLGNEEPADGGHDFQLERMSLERLRLQLAQKERQLSLREEQLQQEHSKEISALKQENYMLQSKLHSAEEASKKQRWAFGEASDPVTEEKLKQIEKEMKEQETLIQGYHSENEKLYLQMKTLQMQNKQNEEVMFAENQRLLSELAFTREQLSKRAREKTVGSVGVTDQGYRVTELQAQVHTAQKMEAELQEEIHRLKQEKQVLQVDLQMMKKERDLAKAQAVSTSGDKNFELKLLEERHKEEVAALKKRLQWYAENQELLDKDAVRLRAANTEIQRLTEQVEKLKIEVSKQANQHQKKVKERAGQAKKIQDLERQVKEMEQILRRRHPNSLPALMFAAAAADGELLGEGHVCTAPQPSQTTALLERRILRLEAELEGRDEEAKRSLRAMEQHFQRIKLQYELQISDLEKQLVEHQSPEHLNNSGKKSETQPHILQEELEQLKEAHKSQLSVLKSEVASLQEQLCLAHSTTEPEKCSRHQKQAESAQAVRMERLTQELATKSRTIQELKRTVERLQKERKGMLLSPKPKSFNLQTKQVANNPNTVPAEIFPAVHDEKDYQPRAFSGSHITEVQQENQRLRTRLELLEQRWEEERVSLQTAASQEHAKLLRVQQDGEEQLLLLKADHQKELERLVAHHALENSTSKVSKLTNQVKSQEIMVLHLREQLKELQRIKEALAVSKLREETLQSQLTKLLEELKQAKEAHSPELRHFASLERKIHTMELRYNRREQELQQMIAQTRSVVEQEQQAEVARWKRLAQGKSSELEAFRLELDSILDVLRELQKQGVVIPAAQQSSASGYIFRPLKS